VTSESNIKGLSSEIARRERRAVRRSWLYSGVALLVSALWLTYTVYTTNQLGNQAAAQKNEIGENEKQLTRQRKQIEKNKKTIESLAPHALDDFGFKEASNTQVSDYQIDQSLDADSARKQLAAKSDSGRRQNVQIEYFWKNVDYNKVEEALRQLGFKVTVKEQINDLATNALWFGTQVNQEDAKLVAYTLIRAGIQFKGIRYFRPTSPRANTALIQIGSDPALVNKPALTVDEIRNKTQFESNY
jgi:hypothetical protein